MPLSAAVMGGLLALCFLLMLVTQNPINRSCRIISKADEPIGYWVLVTATRRAATILLYFTLELIFI